MILTCPNCSTQYVVKDGAIPPGGRQVRCAACKHSWHQNPEEMTEADGGTTAVTEPEASPPMVEAEAPSEPEADTQVEPQAESDWSGEAPATEEPEQAAGDDDGFAEATLIEPRSGPEAEERAFEEAALEGAEADPAVQEQVEAADWREPPVAEVQDDEFTPFPPADDDEPRRRSPIVGILVVVLVVIALAALFWFLAPGDLKAKLGLASAGATPLALVTTHMDRQRLASGQELLTVTGRIINPTAKSQDVPPLQAQLKTKAGRVVYNWTIAPPTRTLPAGASASFNSTEVSVPPGGEELTITLSGQAG